MLGTHIYAVGGNESAARLAGVNVAEVLLFVYGASGLLAGVGGVMHAARLYAANGLQLGQFYELDAIAAVILGGTSFVGGVGSIGGTLVAEWSARGIVGRSRLASTILRNRSGVLLRTCAGWRRAAATRRP